LELGGSRFERYRCLFAVAAIVIAHSAVAISIPVNIRVGFHSFGSDHSSGIPLRSRAANASSR
jgi:hypothetical protein